MKTVVESVLAHCVLVQINGVTRYPECLNEGLATGALMLYLKPYFEFKVKLIQSKTNIS